CALTTAFCAAARCAWAGTEVLTAWPFAVALGGATIVTLVIFVTFLTLVTLFVTLFVVLLIVVLLWMFVLFMFVLFTFTLFVTRMPTVTTGGAPVTTAGAVPI